MLDLLVLGLLEKAGHFLAAQTQVQPKNNNNNNSEFQIRELKWPVSCRVDEVDPDLTFQNGQLNIVDT